MKQWAQLVLKIVILGGILGFVLLVIDDLCGKLAAKILYGG